MRRIVGWLFSPPDDLSPGRVIGWWERRRIPFNIIVGGYGIACLIAFFVAIGSTGYLKPGEDAVEPIAVIFAPCGINILYTLGWLLEVPARFLFRNLPPRVSPFLLAAGFALSFVLISIPMVYWVAYRILQLAGIIR